MRLHEDVSGKYGNVSWEITLTNINQLVTKHGWDVGSRGKNLQQYTSDFGAPGRGEFSAHSDNAIASKRKWSVINHCTFLEIPVKSL